MKMLVATATGQGVRKNDFCHAEPGEFVHFGAECDGQGADDECGCRRSMAGVKSSLATTTFGVADREITRAEFLAQLRKSYLEGGWSDYISDGDIAEEADKLLAVAGKFSVGQVLEKRGDTIRAREGLTFSPGSERKGGEPGDFEERGKR